MSIFNSAKIIGFHKEEASANTDFDKFDISMSHDDLLELIELKHKLNENPGEISDGYHTFNELYHHRAVLFACICNTNKEYAWKSKQHDDPNQPMYDGMFIVGIQTPYGQATYHYNIDPYWDMFHVKELDRAPKYDGHTPDQAIERIGKFIAGIDF